MHVAIPVLFRHVEIVTWFGDLNSDLRKHLEIFWQHEVMKYPLRNTSTIKWLDCVAVGRLLCAIHDLIGQALGDGLDVSEGTVSCTGANQVDGLIHSAQWRHIYSLTAHHTCWAHSCGVFTRTSVLHSIHEHLDGVLVGEEVDDLEGMLDNAHCHELLAVVAAMHHHGAHQALNDGAQSLAEASHLVSALSVGKEQLSRFADGNVVHQTQVRQHHILVGPQSRAVVRGWHSGFIIFSDKLVESACVASILSRNQQVLQVGQQLSEPQNLLFQKRKFSKLSFYCLAMSCCPSLLHDCMQACCMPYWHLHQNMI